MWKFIRGTLVALGALTFTGGLAAIATNYTVTQRSGTTFGSIVVGGVNYAQHFLCDLTTPAQCAKVSSTGSQQVGGEGTAGSPAGGVVSVQGVGSGTALPVSAASFRSQRWRPRRQSSLTEVRKPRLSTAPATSSRARRTVSTSSAPIAREAGRPRLTGRRSRLGQAYSARPVASSPRAARRRARRVSSAS